MANLGKGLAMALMSVGNSLTEHSKEKRSFARDLALARAKMKSEPQSKIGKVMYDLFGEKPEGGDYGADQYARGAEMAGRFDPPSGGTSVNMEIPGFRELATKIIGDMNGQFGVIPPPGGNQTPAFDQSNTLDLGNGFRFRKRVR